MKVNYNQFLAVVYADMFDYPLTKAEMNKWQIAGFGKNQRVGIKNGLCYLPGREKLVQLRKERELISKKKSLKLLEIAKIIQEIATVEAIFVTGSLAVNNATYGSDLDLMIITSPGTMWRTRIKVLFLLKKLRKLRDDRHVKDRTCTNIYLDLNHLEIKEKNLYTAHEIVQARCVFDRKNVLNLWIFANLWVGEYLPKSVKSNKENVGGGEKKKFSLLELLAFFIQYLYMFPKITNEKVGVSFAFFHPVNGSKFFLTKFQKRLASLAVIE